jgi:hypothetical protein
MLQIQNTNNKTKHNKTNLGKQTKYSAHFGEINTNKETTTHTNKTNNQ